MSGSLAPKRLVSLAAGTTAALAAVAGATHAAGLPDAVGIAVDVLVLGGAAVAGAVRGGRTEAETPTR